MKATINIHLFDLKQEIIITDPSAPNGYTTYHVTLDDLPTFLTKYQELEEVHLFGANAYVQMIEENIKKEELKKYNYNKIKFYENK